MTTDEVPQREKEKVFTENGVNSPPLLFGSKAVNACDHMTKWAPSAIPQFDVEVSPQPFVETEVFLADVFQCDGRLNRLADFVRGSGYRDR